MKRAAVVLFAALLTAPAFASAQIATSTVSATSTTPYSLPLPKADPAAILQLNEAFKLLKIVQDNVKLLGLLPKNPEPIVGVDNSTSLQAALDALKRSIYGATFVQIPLTQVQEMLAGTSTPQTIAQVIAGSGCVAVSSSLQSGSSGAEVSNLQAFLTKIPAIYPEGQITGYFGAMTKKAVERLQGALGIEQTGAIGPLTRTTLRALTCR